MFLIMHDVRTDTMLMGWVIFSIWQLVEWFEHKEWKNFFLAFLGIAGGMMTKGPIALMVPIFALIPHFVLRREWKQFFRIEYLLGLVIIAIALIPMSIGLYQQFDLHPGKLINGDAVKSGLRFYYWTQSFGRYTGENHFREMNDFTFLLQNMLWSFLPWIIFFLFGLFFDMIGLVQDRFQLSYKQEWITSGGFIITYCILGRSQAQLPHYIFIVFPLAAIITAKFLYRLFFTNEMKLLRKVLSAFHIFIFTLLWILAIVLMAYPFAGISKLVPAIASVLLVVMYVLLWSKKLKRLNIVGICFYTTIGINLLLNTFFYPSLLKYQIGSSAANYINDNQIPKAKVVMYGKDLGHSFDFYGQHIFPLVHSSDLQVGEVVIAPKDSLSSLQLRYQKSILLCNLESYGVTQLSLPFLNPKTRDKELEKYVILSLRK